MSQKPKVVIVDDEESIRKLLSARFTREGFDVVTAQDASEAEKCFNGTTPVGVVVTDLKMPGKDGIALMSWVKEKSPATRSIMITGHGEKEVAIQALKHGASDYMEKPFDMDEITHSVRRCMREFQLENENQDLVSRLEARIERVEGKSEDKYWFVSKAKAMAPVNEWMNVLRRESMRGEAEEPTVLIVGESGTGKEGIARMVHAGSRRAKGPWVAVNCANFGEQLLESELFGHEKGSFTGATNTKKGLFEIAKGGTLFLDELGEMDIKLQARLLRVLQERVFRRVGGTADLQADVRVVAATNVNLPSKVSQGAFREDLYHRLNRVTIELPALKARTEDLVPMATQLAERAFRARGKTFGGFTPDAVTAIETHSWPGNVREMLNVVERTALLFTGSGPVAGKAMGLGGATKEATTSNVASNAPKSLTIKVGVPTAAQGPDLTLEVEGGYMELKKRWGEIFEKEYLIGTLRRNFGNVSAAARESKIDRSNFLRLLRKHTIRADDYRRVGETASKNGVGGNPVEQAA